MSKYKPFLFLDEMFLSWDGEEMHACRADLRDKYAARLYKRGLTRELIIDMLSAWEVGFADGKAALFKSQCTLCNEKTQYLSDLHGKKTLNEHLDR